MKKIGIMQPYLFPYIGYFQTMNAVDDYVIYDDVQYIKGGWINRNNILMGGQKVLFTIRLDDSSANKLINEITIKDDLVKFQKTISMAYSRAPYQKEVCNLLSEICSFEDKNLARFIGNSFQKIARYLDIKTNLIYSSSLKKDNNLRAQDKVIAICKELEGDTYINAIGGQELYSKEDFKANDLSLKFLHSLVRPYKQLGKEFVPSLSIIDVMMFNSAETVNKMLNEFELV